MNFKKFDRLLFALMCCFIVKTAECKLLHNKISEAQNFINPIQEPILKLKAFQLTIVKLLDQNKLAESPKLDSNGRAIYKIEQIDAFYDDAYVYHLIDTLLQEPNRQLILIGREYINENIVWMCSYLNGKLVYSKQVYYDNAEGNYLLESKLEKLNLILTSDDVNEGKKTERYTITNQLEWKRSLGVKKK